MNHTISIIIPCKNRVSQLVQCLPTVLNQTYRDLQVIVVDFNCPQLGEFYIEKNHPLLYEDIRLEFYEIDVPENHWNLSEARNAGYEFIRGEKLLFLDADTILQPTFIEDSVKKLNDNSFVTGLNSPPWNGCGCLFVNKKDFYSVKGYNEAMKGWGMEDMNMYHRLELIDLKHEYFDPSLIQNLPHTDDQRNEYHNGRDKYETLEENNQIHLKGIFKSSIK